MRVWVLVLNLGVPESSGTLLAIRSRDVIRRAARCNLQFATSAKSLQVSAFLLPSARAAVSWFALHGGTQTVDDDAAVFARKPRHRGACSESTRWTVGANPLRRQALGFELVPDFGVCFVSPAHSAASLSLGLSDTSYESRIYILRRVFNSITRLCNRSSRRISRKISSCFVLFPACSTCVKLLRWLTSAVQFLNLGRFIFDVFYNVTYTRKKYCSKHLYVKIFKLFSFI